MTHEGFVLVVRAAVVLSLLLLTAMVRTFTGSSTRRGIVMGTGMLGGLAFGVGLGYVLPASFNTHESPLLAVGGLLLGWTVAWFFARTTPREAN